MKNNYKSSLALFPLFLIVSLITYTCSAQVSLQNIGGKGAFQTVIELPGKTSDEIYSKANRWVVTVYKNPDRVVSGRIENELIKGNGAAVKEVKLAAMAFETLTYMFIIEIKEEKIRFTLSDMRVGNYLFETYMYKPDGTERTNTQATNIKQSTTQIATALVSSLETFLKDDAKADDW